MHIEVVEPPWGEAGEPYNPALLLDYPDFVPGDDPAAEFRAILVLNGWQIRHRVPGSDEDVSDGIGVDR